MYFPVMICSFRDLFFSWLSLMRKIFSSKELSLINFHMKNYCIFCYELFFSRFIHMRNIASVIYILGNFGTFYYNLDYLLMMFRKMIFFIWIFLNWFFIYWYFGDGDNLIVFKIISLWVCGVKYFLIKYWII